MNIYIKEKDMPKSCKKCKFIRGYKSGPFHLNPHSCCELAWNLFENDLRVDDEIDERDENCPLCMISESDEVKN